LSALVRRFDFGRRGIPAQLQLLAFGRAVFRLVWSFWFSAVDTFPLDSKYFGRAAAAVPAS
jgi:hypothetical protein